MQPNEIKSIRESLGLNQALFGQLMGVHPMTVSKWERGVSPANPYQEAFFRQFEQAAMDKEIRNTLLGVLIGAGVIMALALLLKKAG